MTEAARHMQMGSHPSAGRKRRASMARLCLLPPSELGANSVCTLWGRGASTRFRLRQMHQWLRSQWVFWGR